MKKENFTDTYHSRIEEGVKGDRLRLLAYPDGSVMKRGREEAAEYKAQTDATTDGTGVVSPPDASTATVNKIADDGLGGTFNDSLYIYTCTHYILHEYQLYHAIYTHIFYSIWRRFGLADRVSGAR